MLVGQKATETKRQGDGENNLKSPVQAAKVQALIKLTAKFPVH